MHATYSLSSHSFRDDLKPYRGHPAISKRPGFSHLVHACLPLWIYLAFSAGLPFTVLQAEAQRTQRIREEVADALRTFYCDVCQKQYASALELDQHLSSYDHHHRKRMTEMRAMVATSSKKEREKREKKEAAREHARMQAQYVPMATA